MCSIPQKTNSVLQSLAPCWPGLPFMQKHIKEKEKKLSREWNKIADAIIIPTGVRTLL